MSENWSRPRAPTNGEFLNSKNQRNWRWYLYAPYLIANIQRASKINYYYFHLVFKDSWSLICSKQWNACYMHLKLVYCKLQDRCLDSWCSCQSSGDIVPTSTPASWPCITLQQECSKCNYLAQPQHTALCTQVAMETHSWSLSMSLEQHSQASRHSAAWQKLGVRVPALKLQLSSRRKPSSKPMGLLLLKLSFYCEKSVCCILQNPTIRSPYMECSELRAFLPY